MNLNIANCPRCGKIFARGFSDVCANCHKEIEKQYEACVQYLRENRGATINDLSEAVDVSIKQITKFIREGRISLYNAPNMSYPCDACGTLIREGHMCDTCRKKLTNQVNRMNEAASEMNQQERRRGLGFQIKDDKS